MRTFQQQLELQRHTDFSALQSSLLLLLRRSNRGKMTVKQNALVELRAQTTVDCDTMDLEGKLVLSSVSVKSADGEL